MNLWKGFSISKKLYTIFSALVAIVVFEFLVLAFALYSFSAIRAFIGGEGIWSKAQKDAINNLQTYVVTGNAYYYDAFWGDLQIPFNDRQVRLEVESTEPNINRVYSGLESGGIHPDDVENMGSFFIRFKEMSFFVEARKVWSAGDKAIDELSDLANEIHIRIGEGPLTEEVREKYISEISIINDRLTKLENDFSGILADSSREVESLLKEIVFGITTVATFACFLLLLMINRHFSKGIKRINRQTRQLGKGNFDEPIEVNSSDELGDLAHSINRMAQNIKENIAMRENAEEASKVKSLFLANMSHEIRTPLNAIVGFAELLENDNLSVEKRKDFLKVIQKTGKNLAAIINDILDISKIESGYLEIQKEKENLHELLDEVTQLLKFKSNEKEIELILERDASLPQYAKVDSFRLKQILINILSNAIKFTKKGKVLLTAKLHEGFLVFDVIDTGIGISPEYQTLVFDIFQQGDNCYTKKIGGTGLGLPLSRRLAQIMGGNLILISSEVEKGSHFQINIKYEKAERDDQTNWKLPKDHSMKNETISLNNLNILVVDDAEENRLLLMAILENCGCKVSCATNGEEGVKLALETQFDAIVMDIQMPLLDGYQAVKKIREHGIETPIIALTAYSIKEAQDKCLESGFDDVLMKPIYPHNLIDKIAEYSTPHPVMH
ncbi:MAG: response regulator [Halobacteriovoraceae bacterium]|nr:response regulator [Halobacteriovoraceae bacterium]MCB9095293.1 response regulator [Halobacteriovoraceae bacterium]